MIVEIGVYHRTVEGGKGTLVGVVGSLLEPFFAEFQGILKQSAGTEDIHFQVEIALAAIICYRQYGVTVEVLQIVIPLAHIWALGIEA